MKKQCNENNELIAMGARVFMVSKKEYREFSGRMVARCLSEGAGRVNIGLKGVAMPFLSCLTGNDLALSRKITKATGRSGLDLIHDAITVGLMALDRGITIERRG